MSPNTLAPFGAASAGEWLSIAADTLSAAPESERTQQLTAIAFLTAALERQAELTAPSASALAPLRDALRQPPSPLVHLPTEHPAHEWLQLSALAEFLGEPALARIIVNAIAMHCGEHAATAPTTDDAWQREVLAICWCRRGRMSRLWGLVDDAEYCYTEGFTLVEAQPWRDARIAAALGLINIALARGNFPLAERRCTALLADPRACLAPAHGTAAYQMRAIAYRKRGRALDALLDSWRAYDLLGHADAFRAELVVTMAETALEVGDVPAAIAGFRNAQHEAVQTGAPLRVQAGAIIGLARAITACLLRDESATTRLTAHDIEDSRAALSALFAKPLAPRERVYALVAHAECLRRERTAHGAREVLLEAQELAQTHGYFDYQFRVDELLQGLATPSTVTAGWTEADRHPALARLAALT